MRHLRIVENDAVLELARVAHRDAVADNDVLTHVTAAADLAVLADPCGAFQDRALFDNRTAADKNIVADERFADQLAEHRRFQTKLQIARNLFERVPDVILVLEQFRMRSVFEAQIIGRREHLLAPKMIKALVLGEPKLRGMRVECWGARAPRPLCHAPRGTRTWSCSARAPNRAGEAPALP